MATPRKPQVVLPPEVRAEFDRLRRVMGRTTLAKRLGISITAVESLENGGNASSQITERVVAALGGEL